MEHERDLAHEADMRQLRREQLRADCDGGDDLNSRVVDGALADLGIDPAEAEASLDDEEPLDDPEWADQASIDAGDWD